MSFKIYCPACKRPLNKWMELKHAGVWHHSVTCSDKRCLGSQANGESTLSYDLALADLGRKVKDMLSARPTPPVQPTLI